MGQPVDMAALRALLDEHLGGALRLADMRGAPVSRYRQRVLQGVASCGDPHAGFVWLRCDGCDIDRAVAMSCGGRVACPRCGGRRMSATAARLVDDVLPAEDLRQWVFTFPQPLPKLLAWRPDLLTVLLGDIAAVVQRDLQRRTGQPTGRTGMVSLIQTFAGDLRLFVHVHALVLDGVYVEDGGGLRFVEAPVPTQQDITKVAQEVAARVQRSCARWRKGLQPGRDDFAAQMLDRVVQLSGQPVVGVRPSKGTRPRRRDRRWLGAHLGIEVHAGVAVAGSDRVGRERLARYAARSAIALTRLTLDDDGQVFIRFKRSWRTGQQGVRLSPEAFILRIASLLFPPRANLIRYHGVFAPASPLRARVVPRRPAQTRGKRPSRWIRWRTLILRVFGRVADACPGCGQRMGVVATLHGHGRAWYGLRWIEDRATRGRDGPP